MIALVNLSLIALGMVWLMSRFSWRHFAARYATDAPMAGRPVPAAYVRLHRPRPSGSGGRASYSGIIRIHAAADGLDLRLPLPSWFSLGHRPLRLPWAHVADVDVRGKEAWCVFRDPYRPSDGVFEVGVPLAALPSLEEAMADGNRPR
jgi:hypothetical protein